MVAEPRAIAELPPDVDRLLDAAAGEGHNLMSRLVEEWRDGSNRFDGPGEVLAEVRCGGALCGVGGVNVDPYIDDPTVGRIRHVYVHPSRRRQGVGKTLIEYLVEHARGHFERVRLRSLRDPGPDFYAALGFASTDEPDATHVVWLHRHTAAE